MDELWKRRQGERTAGGIVDCFLLDDEVKLIERVLEAKAPKLIDYHKKYFLCYIVQ